MKHVLLAILIFAGMFGFSQAKLSMSKVYSITPTGAGSPSVGVSYGDTVNIFVSVKNTGNQPFSGNIVVEAKRDTVAGVSCGSSTLSVTSLAAGDSISSVVTFTPNPGINAFKVNGNGNTIVVWPFAINALAGDSIRPIIWISTLTGINEVAAENFKLFPNPASNTINVIANKKERYHTVMIFDMLARKQKDISYQQTIDISELSQGCYWMFIVSEERTYKMRFVKQ